jgi:hypothetical protein
VTDWLVLSPIVSRSTSFGALSAALSYVRLALLPFGLGGDACVTGVTAWCLSRRGRRDGLEGARTGTGCRGARETCGSPVGPGASVGAARRCRSWPEGSQRPHDLLDDDEAVGLRPQRYPQALADQVGQPGRLRAGEQCVRSAQDRGDRAWRGRVRSGQFQRLEVAAVATNAVHYATPKQGKLAAAMAAVRARRSLEELAGWLPPAPTAFIRSGAEMQQRFGRYPGAVQRAAVLGVDAAFDLHLVAPELPPFPVPDGHTETSFLRHLTMAGALRRYGERESNTDAYRQMEHELADLWIESWSPAGDQR